MQKRISTFIIAVLVIFSSFQGNAQARLDKITKSGVLKIGMTGNQVPFTMEAKDGSLMGYEVDPGRIAG